MQSPFNIIPSNGAAQPFPVIAPAPSIPARAQRAFSRVALISMPWGSIRKPALAIPILKRCAQMAGFSTDVHLLTMRLAEMIGINAYESLADQPFYPEWFFSQYLFGKLGSGEIANSWAELTEKAEARDFVGGVLKGVNDSEELCVRIASDVIPKFIEECVREIDWGRYGAIGFTTTFAQSLSSAALAKRIKEAHPHVSIIFGGANVDDIMGVEFLKAFPWVDHVVHGEGETVFPLLLDSLATSQPGRVIGVSSRAGEAVLRGDQDHPPFVDLNQSPVPDYSDHVTAIEQSSFKNQVAMTLFFESSRGCWWGAKHHCTFCGLNANGMSYRKKDARKVYEEIIEITATTKTLNLFATDNILPLEYFQEMLPRVTEADLDIHMFYEVKANLTKAQIKMLADSGVRAIQPGIESFSSRLLTEMQKGISAIQNIQFLKWCAELHVSPAYNILFGFPGERAEDYARYVEIFGLLEHLEPPISMGPVIFERFSPYHFDRARWGLDLEATDAYSYLYPRDRVEVENLAYYFQQRGQPKISCPHMEPVFPACERWRLNWKQTHFFYNKGPGYLVLNDNRGLGEPERKVWPHRRQTVIKEPGASIYLFCDQNRSLSSVCKMVREKFGSRYSDKLVEAILQDHVKKHLMFHEDNRYLSLATRSRTMVPMKYTG